MQIVVIEGFSCQPVVNSISLLYPKYFQGFDYQKYDDRPYSTNEWSDDYGHYRYLQNEIHDWLKSYNIDYKIKYFQKHKQRKNSILTEYIYWVVDIQNDEIALLFKLTWGGKIFKK